MVALAGCRGYEPLELNRATAQLLQALEPLDLPRGGRILLKPNCLSCHDGPDQPVNTRAEVVEAVGRYLLDTRQARLVIADSGGLGSYGRSRKAYEIMGLDRVARELGADLVNLERTGLIEIQSPRGAVLKSFQATALLDQVEAVVNLPQDENPPPHRNDRGRQEQSGLITRIIKKGGPCHRARRGGHVFGPGGYLFRAFDQN